ncbi:hypothetical protein KCW65_22040, partial [Mycobacterium tuberculosis]|nr:hypothetical protein [Mycobacterium tuberculosis]
MLAEKALVSGADRGSHRPTYADADGAADAGTDSGCGADSGSGTDADSGTSAGTDADGAADADSGPSAGGPIPSTVRIDGAEARVRRAWPANKRRIAFEANAHGE